MNKYLVAFLCVSSFAYAAEQSYVSKLRVLLRAYHVAKTTRINCSKVKKIKSYFKKAKKAYENVNQSDAQGRTLAHDLALAVPSVSWIDVGDVFNYFSMAGVNFVAKNGDGKTPCEIANERLALLLISIPEENKDCDSDDSTKAINWGDCFSQETKINKTRNDSCFHFVSCCATWARAHEARLAREAQGKVSSSSSYDSDEEGVCDE